MKKIQFTFYLVFIFSFCAFSQDRDAILTLSKGRYNEVPEYSKYQRVGSVIMNMETRKIAGFADQDTALLKEIDSDHITRWFSVDPLAEKYYSISPYTYTYNNPILYADPDGREGIVVSGQPGDHKNEQHFLINGLDRATKMQEQFDKEGNGEKATWFVFNNGDVENGGYSDEVISEYKEKAGEAGINIQVTPDSDKIIEYVNEKTGEDSRANDLVSNFTYIGHATPGDLDIGFINHNSINMMTNETLDVSEFDKDAFSKNSNANLVGGCRTAVKGNLLFEKSVANQMSKKVGGTVKASNVRVNYLGGVMSDKNLVKTNKGKIVIIQGRNK